MGSGTKLTNRCAVMSKHSSERMSSTPPGKMGVLVVDDSELARVAIASELSAYSCVHIAGQAEDGTEGFALATQLQPDLVLTDLEMPGLGGLELVQRLRAKFPRMRLVVTSAHQGPTLHAQCLRHGADDFVPKERLPHHLPHLLNSFFPHLCNIDTKKGQDEN